MDYEDNLDQEFVDHKSVALPIGTARVQGPIEDFTVTIYDRMGSTYRFRVLGGNICSCNNEDAERRLEYEVH